MQLIDALTEFTMQQVLLLWLLRCHFLAVSRPSRSALSFTLTFSLESWVVSRLLPMFLLPFLSHTLTSSPLPSSSLRDDALAKHVIGVHQRRTQDKIETEIELPQLKRSVRAAQLSIGHSMVV